MGSCNLIPKLSKLGLSKRVEADNRQEESWELVGAHMGPWALMGPYMGPYGSSWTGLGSSANFPPTFRKTFWTNFARFRSKTCFLIKFLDDSASFFVGEAHKSRYFNKKPQYLITNPENTNKH